MTIAPEASTAPAPPASRRDRRILVAVLIVLVVLAAALALILTRGHADKPSAGPSVAPTGPAVSASVPSAGVRHLDASSLVAKYGAAGTKITEADQTTVFYTYSGAGPDAARASVVRCRVANQNNPAAAKAKAATFLGDCALLVYAGVDTAQASAEVRHDVATLLPGTVKATHIGGVGFTVTVGTDNSYDLNIAA